MSAENDKGKDREGVSLGNVLIAGEDVLLQYELTKLVLDFAQKKEIMSHKLIGLLDATKHGLCTYTDMICVGTDVKEKE